MRKFLVVLDDSRECLNAMRFAAMRASKTGGGVAVLSVIPPDEFNHWVGVGEIMREESRERITAHFEVFAKWMRDRQNVDPELVIREGDPVTQIIAQVDEDPEIGTVARTPVSIEARPDGRIALTEGPEPGTEIVMTGVSQLKDGQTVRRFKGIGE